MSRKQAMKDAVLAISAQAMHEVDSIPDAVFGSVEEYTCAGKSNDGKIRVEIRVAFSKAKPFSKKRRPS